jgi:hypothetical protein
VKQIMTFPRTCEFDKARSCLDRLGHPYERVSPAPGYARVGVESLVMSQEARAAMFHEIGTEVMSAGWVDYRPAQVRVPESAAAVFEEDIFGSCWIVVMAPCVADLSKIRLPGTNCRACGEKTCMAFALGLWNGAVDPTLCAPVFSGEHGHLKGPLLQICSSLGLAVGAGAMEEA